MLLLKRTNYFMITSVFSLWKAPLPLLLGLVLPIITWLFLTCVFKNGDIKDISMVVVDMDNSQISRKIITDLESTEYLKIVLVTSSKDIADNMLKESSSFFTVVIEKDFSSNVKTGKGGSVNVIINGAYLMYAKIGYKAIAGVLVTNSTNYQIKKLIDNGFSENEAEIRALPLTTDIYTSGNPYFNYTIYLIPGMLISILQMSSSFSTLWLFHQDREHSAGRIIPPKGYRIAFVIGKLIPLFIINLTAVLVLFTLIFPLAGIPINSSYLKIFGLTVILSVVSMGMGALLSVLLPNLVTASQLLLAINAPSFVFSGYTFPRWAMPGGIEMFADLIPVTHFLDAFFPLFLFDYPPQKGVSELILIGIILWGITFILISSPVSKFRNFIENKFSGLKEKETYAVTD